MSQDYFILEPLHGCSILNYSLIFILQGCTVSQVKSFDTIQGANLIFKNY